MKNEDVFQLCKSVFRNDKTSYGYDGKHAENRFGLKPKNGKRWNTPWEMAQDFVKEHFPEREHELFEEK